MARSGLLLHLLCTLNLLLQAVTALPRIELRRRQALSGLTSSNGLLGAESLSDLPLSGILDPLTGGAASTVAPSSAPPSPLTIPNPIRGVNIGGWLVLEKWMNSDVFEGTTAVDEWTFGSTPGAQAKLANHWQTYFTQNDVQMIASWGLNAMRIPIGFWAYNNTGTPYITGADEYLEQAIGWARQAGLLVLIDLHGSPGSQNGWENSGRTGAIDWQISPNMQSSISVLEQITTKYGSAQYADVVFGIELVNEPLSGPSQPLSSIKQWAQEAFQAVKAKSTNPNLQVVMHDAFQQPDTWSDVVTTLNAGQHFALDTHLYQNQDDLSRTLNQDQHIQKVCTYSTYLASTGPVYVGEFTAATDICANPDGTTVGGATCTTSGCQCSVNVGIDQWQQPLKDATRRFLEAQLDVYEAAAKGWFMWSYNGPGGWGLKNLMQYGIAGPKITDRRFANPCAGQA